MARVLWMPSVTWEARGRCWGGRETRGVWRQKANRTSLLQQVESWKQPQTTLIELLVVVGIREQLLGFLYGYMVESIRGGFLPNARAKAEVKERRGSEL